MSGRSLSAGILLAVLVTVSANIDENLLSTRRLEAVEPRTCPTGTGLNNVHIPHEFDCTLFYHCSHGKKILKECALGLEFNALLEVCDWPFSAKCTLGNTGNGISTTEKYPVTGSSSSTGSGGSSSSSTTGTSSTTGNEISIPTECSTELKGESVHIAHETDCGLFYHCDFGKKVLKECPYGLAFNSILQVCDWPEFANCSLGVTGSTSATSSSTTESLAPIVSTTGSSPPSVSTTESSAPSVSTTEASSSSSWTTGSSVPSESTTESEVIVPTECPLNNDGDSVHLAHETNCNLFYHCDNGEKVLKQCAASLHFNPVLQVCDWPGSAGCSLDGSGGSESSTTESSGSGSSTTSSSTDSGNGDNEATVIVPTECPDEFDNDNVHIAHESDCGSFYQCVHGDKVQKECPAGLAFNPVLQVCDWPESAGCTLDGSSATTSSSGSGSSTNEDSHTTSSGSGTWTTGSSGSSSSGSGSWTSDGSHTTSSGSGTWTTGSSGSSSSGSGSWTSDGSHTTSSGSGTWTTGSSGSSSSTTSSSDSETGTGITNSDSGISSTTDSGSVITVPTKCPADFEEDNVHLAHESDCGLFYQCVHGEKVERECPDGLHFNAILQVCDWPESAGCSLDGSGGSGSSTTESSGSGSSTTSSSTDSGNGNNEATVIVPTECPDEFNNDNVHIAHESDCGLFYQCVHGNKVQKECPPGLAFNPVLQVCDWPESAGCTLDGSGNGDSNNGTTDSTDQGSGSGSDQTTPPDSSEWNSEEWDDGNEDGTSVAGPQDDTTDSGIIIPTECPAEFEGDSVHIAHESNCGLFYHCVHGEKVEKECPAGLHFNPVLQVCDWPGSAGCSLDGSGGSGSWTTESSGSGSSTTSSSTDTGNGGNDATVIVPTKCSEEFDDDNVHIAHESDCGSFYQCVHGEKVEKKCPAGLAFNPVLQVCDWPESAGCTLDGSGATTSSSGSGSSTNEDSHTTGSGSGTWTTGSSGSSSSGSGSWTSDGSYTTSSSSGTWNNEGSSTSSTIKPDSGITGIVPTECPADFEDGNTHIAHESNCGLFYHCVHGEKVEKECPAGLHFNPVLQVCDWPESAKCSLTGSGGSGSGGSGSGGSGSGGSGSGGSGSGGSGSGGSGSGTTESGVTVMVPTECPINGLEDDSVHIAHETNCSNFYHCVHGEKVEKHCPSGLHFNPVLQVCDWPESAGCVSSGSTTPAGSSEWESNEWTESPGGDSGSTDVPNDSSESGSGGNGDDSDGGSGSDSGDGSGSSGIIVPTECPADFEDGNTHIAHESECGLFYHCVHGEKVEKECPAGLHFNPVLQVCDWPESAKCSLTGSGGSGSGGSGSGGSGSGGSGSGGSGSGGSGSGGSGSGGSGSGGSGSGTTESGVTVIVPTECPINGLEDDSVHIAHETNCSNFYHCVHGEKVEKHCPSGLHFNPVLQVCDWPESAGCVPSGSTTPAGSSEWESNEWTESPGGDSGSTDVPNDSSESGSGGNGDDSDGGSGSDSGNGSGSSGIIVPTECPADFEDDNTHIAHETECYLFYQCVHGHKVPVKCPHGLHFNPILQVCDWPESANCTLTGSGGSGSDDSSTDSPGSGSETTESGVTVIVPTKCPVDDSNGDSVHIAHETDCGIFYHCVNGEKVEKHCPSGLHFNPVLQVCDWPESAGCVPSGSTTPAESSEWESNEWTESPGGDSGSTDVPNDSSESGSGSNGDDSDGGSGSDSGNGSGSSEIIVPTKCPADFEDDNTHIAHETECYLFYQCVHGHKVPVKCPHGLHFNPVLQVCDWPESANCTLTGSGGSGSDDSSTGSPGSGSETTESGVTVIPPTECPIDDSNGDSVHIAHESNCGVFYHCVNGEKVEKHCPSGLHFNPVLQVCDWPESAGCVSSGSTTPAESSEWESNEWTESPGGDSGSTDVPNDSSESGSGSNGDDSDGGSGSDSGNGSGSSEIIVPTKCPADFEDGNTHIAHETECYLFYQCVHGHKVPVKCPHGLHFNPILQVCDWPESANCTLTGSGGSGSDDSSTDSPGSSSETTESGVTVIPPTECPIDDSNLDSVHIAHESDCNIFYHCVDGDKVEKSCPDGLHFNPVLQVCDWPESAGCNSNTGSSDSSEWNEDTTDESGNSVTDSTTESDWLTTVYPDRENCKYAELCPIEDPLDYTIILPHRDCKKFCKCSNGDPYVYDCPKGLIFNRELKVCDWTDATECPVDED